MQARISSLHSIFKLEQTPIVALLLLSACSGGPSSSDIKAAAQVATDGLFGKGAAVIEEVSNVSCKESQAKPGYVCAFTTTVMNNMTKSHTSQTTEARFVQSGSNWAMMNDL